MPKVDDEKIAKRESALALKCYNKVFDESTRRIVSNIDQKWFRKCSCLRFNIGGQTHFLNHAKELPTPYASGCSLLGVIDGELGEEVIAFANEKEDAVKKIKEVRAKLQGQLGNISTFKKLRELWPEGQKFYNDLDEDATIKSGLPAIRFDDVNTMLGVK